MINDPKAFFEKVLRQTVIKSPDTLTKMMSQDQATNEEYLVELLSDRIAKLLADGRRPTESIQQLTEPDLIDKNMVTDYEYLIDKNNLLSAAVGACECWGEISDCPHCGGEGVPGWLRPEPEAFEYFIKPAMKAFSR